MRRSPATIITGIVLAGALTVEAAGPTPLFIEAKGADNYKILFIERASAPPALDGKLQDPCWQGIAPNADFGFCEYGARRYAAPKTEFKYLWDDTYLYVAFTCYEDSAQNLGRVKAADMDKSKLIYVRDCIELHIDGNNDNATRFQVWFNPPGEKMIFWHYDFGWGILVNENYGLSANWDYAVGFGKDSWAVEGRIALSHIQVKPEAGTIFGMNPARFRFNKAGVRDDGAEADAVTMFLTWSTQGGDHHNVSAYGKCILVEKKPESLKAGLELAYPDLDERALMIQTPKGFTVFSKGSESRLAYLDKVRQELAEVEAVAGKTGPLLKDPALANSYHSKTFAAETEKLTAIRAETDKLQTIGAAELGKFRTRLGDIHGALDRIYWTARRQRLLAGQEAYTAPAPNVPRIRATPDEPENVPDPATRKTPCVPWAKGHGQGKTRALVITAEGAAWNAYELKQRMDLDADIYYATGGVQRNLAPATDYYKEDILLYPEKVRRLKALFRNAYDVIVFIDMSPSGLPGDMQFDLTGKLLSGTPIVSFQSRQWSFHGLPGRKWQDDTTLIRSIPHEHMTQLRQEGYVIDHRGMALDTLDRKPVPLAVPPVKKIQVGEGTYYSFTPGAGGYFFSNSLTPGSQQDPDEYFQAEYYYGLATRIILEASGRLGVVRVEEVVTPEQPLAAGMPGTLAVKVAGSVQGSLKVVIRNRLGQSLHTATSPAATTEDKRTLAATVPPLPAGDYYLDAFLSANGKPCGWASQRFSVATPTHIGAVEFASRTVRKGETLEASVTVSNPPGGAVVRADLRDVNGRIVERLEGVRIKNGTAKVRITLSRTWFTYSKLDLAVVHKGRAVAVKTVEVFTPSRAADDFTVFTDGGGNHAYGDLRHRVLREYGSNLLEPSGNAIDSLACGADITTRYWLSHSLNETGGSLASDVYHRKLDATMRTVAGFLAAKGGRFISTGDDSGVAFEFASTYPNWVMPLIGGLARKHGFTIHPTYGTPVVDRAFFTKRGLAHGEYWRWLWRASVNEIINMTLQPGDLDVFKAAFKESYPNISEFNRANGTGFKDFASITAEDLKTIKPPFAPDAIGFQDWLRKRYGTIAELNAIWGCEETSFETIKPVKVINALLAERKYAAQLDKAEYLEDLFIQHMATAARAVRETSPEIGIGQGAGSFANIIPEVMAHTDTFAPYLENVGIEIARAFPHRWVGQTLGVYGGKAVKSTARENQVWHGLFSGANFMWLWSASTGVLMGDLTMNPNRSGTMCENIREAKRGIAASLIRARRLHDGIAILTSRRAGHLSGVVKDLNTHHASKETFQYLIEDQGLQYRYVSSPDIESGVLESGEFTLLVLPYVQALSAPECAAITAFARAGGTVMADFRPGLYDLHGKAQGQGTLDGLFGIGGAPAADPAKGALVVKDLAGTDCNVPGFRGDASVTCTSGRAYGSLGAAPALIVNDLGKGRGMLINLGLDGYSFLQNTGALGSAREAFGKLFAAAGIAPRFTVGTAKSEPVPGVEIAVFQRGTARFLTAEKRSLEHETYPVRAEIKLDGTFYVSDMRSGKRLGLTDGIPVEFNGLSCHVWSLLPYEVEAVEIDLPKHVKRGADLELRIALKTSAKPAPHVVRIEVTSPSGANPYDIRKPDVVGGKLTTTLPVAFNEEQGEWTVRVTDVSTGRSAVRTYTVRAK